MASSAPSKPPSFSYANLVKQGPNTIFAPAPQNDLAMSQPTPSFQAVTAQQQKFQHAEANAERNADRNPGGNQRAPASRPVREQRDQRDQRERKTSNSNYADSSCQLFLGNLPTKATEDQLREMFSIYGRVTELRVHANPTQKNPSQRPVKNYGFITFEDQQSVNNLLNAPVSLYCIN
jgi:RNA recognition motif-containing protein